MADSFSVVSWPLPTGVLAVTLKAEVFLLHGVYKRLRSQSFTSLVSCVVDLFYMPQEKVSPENFWGAQAPPAPPPATGLLS